MFFVDRHDAGRRLAAKLAGRHGPDAVVLGLAPGGVPVAAEVARALGARLDVVSVAGADVVRGGRPAVPVVGRTVIVVDDGVATGSTARAACRVVRARGAARIVLAVPVAPAGWNGRLGDVADEYVCVAAPAALHSVAEAYHEFEPVPDADVLDCLDGRGDGAPLAHDTDVAVPIDGLVLPGRLQVPAAPIGAVVFAHGAGSSHASPRNQYMASVLHEARVATLLVDLVAGGEERVRSKGFDIALLGHRIVRATEWLRATPGLADLPVGYVGASTGAPAAFWAVTAGVSDAVAVVSRGGRADLAMEWLGAVRCPTLLIVGAEDDTVLGLNREAVHQLRGEVRLAVVPGATHLFVEPGTLEVCAALARDFLVRHLLRAQRSFAASTPVASSAAMRSSS